MPNKRAAERALRKTRKNTAINSKIRADIGVLKNQIKKSATASDLSKANELLIKLQQKVDKATKRGLFTKKSGARIKSRIWSKVKVK